MPDSTMQDTHGRIANYMRLSVTDRCNLHCAYCINHQRQQFIPHDRILRYEEFLRLIGIAAKLGTRKIRITGGEPFARRGVIDFLAQIKSQYPDMRLCVTTNATLLGPFLDDLASLQLTSFNISLDSLVRKDFERITGHDALPLVLDNLHGLLARGQKVKINAVVLRGLTDMQISKFIDIIKTYPVDVRFIEFMPIGRNTGWRQNKFISCEEVMVQAGKLAGLKAVANIDQLAGPAQMYEVENCIGRLGFISAVSRHFCAICNRLRITSSGGLRVCLFSDQEYQLAGLLRHPRIEDGQIAKVMLAAMRHKPLGRDLLASRKSKSVAGTQMVSIGG